MNEHRYPSCPNCRNDEFISLPDVVQDLTRWVSAIGVTHVSTWTTTLVVCGKCGRTEVFTKNVEDLASKVPGATRFRAVPDEGADPRFAG